MRRDVLAPLLIGGLVLAAIIAGLFVTGGPMTARAEKRDMARLDDLRRLSSFVRCVKDKTGTIPATLSSFEACGTDVVFLDVTTKSPYRYEKLDDETVQLCAEFERPDLLRGQEFNLGRRQGQTGCYTLDIE